ncbi:asparagine synthase-related protein [Novosphingobium sp.]|uniref:asparagine synthetase B family protein n=1 Tax=Novosphingobium sp. TaxID=1874826 RepID=UPI0025D36711|nr:asparagine synthase-related protein [Novosphingobium sp.]
MSGIAAVIRFDGGPVEPGTVERMTSAMDYRGPDGIAHWQRGSVALGHCMMHTTTESLEEVQPLFNEDESLVLVMDGWLSNWEELRADLLSRGAVLRTRSDAELVLRAYEAWGDDCPRHIDGEYSFLIWDARRNEAYCARDHAGLRPLHYHWDGKRLVVASDIVGVLAGPEVEAKPNPGMIVQFMADKWFTADETIWSGVLRAQAAHWQRFGTSGTRCGRTWHPPTEVTIRYKRDEDYIDHYRELFSQCVRRAARSHRPIGCEVSGGLDSSAVFAMAHELLRAGRLPAPGIKGYTLAFAERGGEADEIDFARAVGTHVGGDIREIAPFLPDLAWFESRAREDRDVPPFPNGASLLGISEAAVNDGGRVMLDGLGGDEWLDGGPLYFAEHLAEGDWAGFLRSWREDSDAVGWRTATWWAFKFGAAQFLPERLVIERRNLLDRVRSRHSQKESPLAPELESMLAQMREVAARSASANRQYKAGRSVSGWLTDVYVRIARDRYSQQCARCIYEARSPMYSRSFIEFALATPERVRSRGGIAKYLHRAALAGMLPEIVTKRETQAQFSQTFKRLLDTMEHVFTVELPQNGSGFINPDGVSKLYDRYRSKSRDGMLKWQLWGVFGCETVLRPVTDSTMAGFEV